MPFGQLLDVIACEQIANGARQIAGDADEEMIPDLE